MSITQKRLELLGNHHHPVQIINLQEQAANLQETAVRLRIRPNSFD